MNWFKSLFKWFESLVKKKWSWEPQIRITHPTIWIPHEEQMKRLKHWFESPIQWFESLMKNKTRRFEYLSYGFESLHKWSKKLKVGQSDSNYKATNSNHSMTKNSNIAKVIQITQIAIQITQIAIQITHSAEALIARPALYNNSTFHLNLSHND